jgi:hypothetical protein
VNLLVLARPSGRYLAPRPILLSVVLFISASGPGCFGVFISSYAPVFVFSC